MPVSWFSEKWRPCGPLTHTCWATALATAIGNATAATCAVGSYAASAAAAADAPLLLLQAHGQTHRHTDTLAYRQTSQTPSMKVLAHTKKTQPRPRKEHPVQRQGGRPALQERTSTATARESQSPSQEGRSKPHTKKGGPTTRTQPKLRDSRPQTQPRRGRRSPIPERLNLTLKWVARACLSPSFLCRLVVSSLPMASSGFACLRSAQCVMLEAYTESPCLNVRRCGNWHTSVNVWR